MASLSIIVTACNNATTIAAALRSVEEALAFFRNEQGSAGAVATEVVVLDDGSTDDTVAQVLALAADRDDWKLVRRDEPSNAARARNTGVRHARGEVLCFLDGDDRFLPPHLAVCWRILASRDFDFVKTGVRLADPVHADWKTRIEHMLVINLGIRRAAHDALGGFPDYHLFRYDGEQMRHERDIFLRCEDVFYNWLAERQLRGCRLVQETVEYCRDPGNAYDRHYPKSCRPFAQSIDDLPPEERFSVRLGEVIYGDLWARRQGPVANGRAEGALPTPRARAQPRRANAVSSDVEALVGQGLRLAEQGRAEEAMVVLQQAVQVRPESARARHNLGVALAQLGRHDEAVGALEEALRLRPDYADACFNLGNALRELGRADEAIARFRQALQQCPDHASAANNLGLTLTETGRAAEAVEPLQRAVALQPGKKEGHNNLGLAYADLGRFAEAEACYQTALRLDAGYVEAHTNLGSACKEQGRLEEALACYQQALWLEPDAVVTHYNRALVWLQQGDYARGWPEYEWRWRRRQARPRHGGRPRWDGSPLAGRTILLWREQGLGDTIQFVRYATLVRRQGGRVVVECPACLVRLLSSCRGIDVLVAEKESVPEFDVQAPLLSLPALLKTTLASVPSDVPYLHAEAEREAAWRQHLGVRQAFRVGVVWQGNPYFRGDRHRSFPLASLAPLAAVEGAQLISLQKEHGLEQVTATERGFPVTILEGLDAAGGAFVDTAAVMRNLDLVVTADTAAAHVAGALGVPVWLALSRAPDWRWGLTGERTPWYPSMRIFRQSQLGDWRSLFERMAAALRKEAATRSTARSSLPQDAPSRVPAVPAQPLAAIASVSLMTQNAVESTSQPKEMSSERLRALARAFPWPAEKPAVEPPREHLGWLDAGTRHLLTEALSADTLFIVELGAWLGLTTRFLVENASNAVVAAIDHWQGSPEHHAHPVWRAMLPTLYETFVALCWNHRHRAIPLRGTTLAGLQLLADYGLSPDLIYIDAEHSYQAVMEELELSKRLFPQAALVGDDYLWQPVRAAVDEFARRHQLGIRAAGNGWGLTRQPG